MALAVLAMPIWLTVQGVRGAGSSDSDPEAFVGTGAIAAVYLLLLFSVAIRIVVAEVAAERRRPGVLLVCAAVGVGHAIALPLAAASDHTWPLFVAYPLASGAATLGAWRLR